MTPSPAYVESTMFAVKCVSYSAIAFHVYEWLNSLTFEIGHIWRKGPRSLVKWQYLVSRYLGIVVQICNAFVLSQMQTYEQVPRKLCYSWYTSQLISGECMLLSLEGSLILRLYALYNRNYWMKTFLITLIFSETLVVMIYGALTLRTINLVGMCIVPQPPLTVAYLAIAQVISQSIMWTLTLLKYDRQQIPLLSLVVRDGSFAYLAMFTLLAAFLVNVFMTYVKIETSLLYHATFPVYIAVVASANCHLIRNMEGMARADVVSRHSTGLEFSSFILDHESEE